MTRRSSSMLASSSAASDRRACHPNGTPSGPSHVIECQGPAQTTKRYGGIAGVVAKVRVVPPVAVGRPFASTVHSAGASTVSAIVARRSGWSKQAKTRWATSIPQYADTSSPIRPSCASAMSTERPLRVTVRLSGSASSTNVLAPGSAHPNRTVVRDRNVSPSLSSNSTSYDATSSSSARRTASARVKDRWLSVVVTLVRLANRDDTGATVFRGRVHDDLRGRPRVGSRTPGGA